MAPSASANNAIGAIGGAVLAACLCPQLWRLYKTRSARDLSYMYLFLYNTGLALTFVYLFYEEAVAGWVCMLLELACCVLLLAAKFYLDRWGPYSARGLEEARSNGKLTSSPSLADELRLTAQDFTSGHSAPFPLLHPAPNHSAQHLLIDARLALPGTPAAAAAIAAAAAAASASKGLSAPNSREGSRRGGKAFGGGMQEGSVGRQQRLAVLLTADGSGRGRTAAARALAAATSAANGSLQTGLLAGEADGAGDVEMGAPARALSGGFGSAGVLAAVGDMLESALGSAGLAVQRRQGQTFPSFRPAAGQQQGEEQQGAGEEGLGKDAAPDMLFLSCRDGYATALFYPATATLSLDLLAASDAAVSGMGQAARAVCQQLQARWPGTRVAGGSVVRLPRL